MQRRQAIRSLFGASALMPAVVGDLLADGSPSQHAAGPGRGPHFAPKAKNVIFIYLSGGFSHIDTFDYKPALIERAGEKHHRGKPLFAPSWEFKPRGRSGLMVSELFPHIGSCADDLCLIRSLTSDHGNHFQATLGLHTGSFTVPRPSFGSWTSYGLGNENRDLPSFVVLAPRMPYAGGQVWGNEFLPAAHAGTRIADPADPVPNLRRLSPSEQVQRLELDLLGQLDRRHGFERPGDGRLAARMKSFETAFGMQMQMPDALDVKRESKATLAEYGLDPDAPRGMAWQCLVARRLVERGVRFVELIDTGSNRNWDSHSNMRDHERLARNVDRPVAALLRDLKSRGLFGDTLVVFATEFGRTPTRDGDYGRGHHPACFSGWLAGAGVKAGHVHGETDELGHQVASDPVGTHDFHATLLHLLGFDHTRLTYRHGGRDFRLTDVGGEIVPGVLA